MFECIAPGLPLSVSCCGAGCTCAGRTISLSNQLIFSVPLIHFVFPPWSDLTLLPRLTLVLLCSCQRASLYLCVFTIVYLFTYLSLCAMLPSPFNLNLCLYVMLTSMAFKNEFTTCVTVVIFAFGCDGIVFIYFFGSFYIPF